MRRLGVFGGTFNPVHNGHLVLAQEALRRGRLEHMLLLPNAQPSHKQRSAELMTATARLHLLRLAFSGLADFRVDEREVTRGGVSYSVDTLRELKAANPNTELVFLLGSDSMEELHRWRAPEELVQLAAFLVHPRSGHAGPYPILEFHPDARVEFLDGPLIDISSTLVRERLKAGLPLRGYVPDAVEAALRAL